MWYWIPAPAQHPVRGSESTGHSETEPAGWLGSRVLFLQAQHWHQVVHPWGLIWSLLQHQGANPKCLSRVCLRTKFPTELLEDAAQPQKSLKQLLAKSQHDLSKGPTRVWKCVLPHSCLYFVLSGATDVKESSPAHCIHQIRCMRGSKHLILQSFFHWGFTNKMIYFILKWYWKLLEFLPFGMMYTARKIERNKLMFLCL